MRALRRFLSGCLLVLAANVGANAALAATPRLQVAAASDLAPCIAALNQAFINSIGDVQVRASIGSSGNLHAQIQHGAPFDVFLSADMDYPRALAKAGAADAASLVVYAYGRLVLWSADPDLDLSQGLAVLRTPRVKRIAIANPDVAPYGRAARAVLQHAGLWDTIQPKLVRGENLAQTAQFIETGNAQAGFVSAAHAAGSTVKGRSWPVPLSFYPVIEQGAIITRHGRSNPLAAKYLRFLQSEAGRTILRQYHFSLPGGGQ